MAKQTSKEVELQRQYYQDTGHKYNEMHVDEKDEHYFGLCFLLSALDYLEVRSILDIGSGTGRALLYMKQRRPDVRLLGIEPVKRLRDIAYESGISTAELVAGDATDLQLAENSFDLVCAFGVLHHIKRPRLAVAEMLRVAKRAIFISDSNNFGQGSILARSVKQLLNSLRLWKIADLIKTRGRGYTLSAGDGLAYSYSVFSNYKQIRRACECVHILNTLDAGINPYRSASHVAVLGVKGTLEPVDSA